MKCFEVTINGRKLCTAGVEDGVLTAILSYVKRESVSSDAPEAQPGDNTESLDIRVGGLENIEPGISAHVDWLTQDISIGDEITIKIIDATSCDEPASKEITYVECSFCGKKQSDVHKLIAGPAVYICDQCVGHCFKAVVEGEPTGNITMVLGKQAEARCSFCGQKPVDVVRMVGVPTARICNQCVKICGDILEGTA
jgi:hypothetical protein